MAKEKTGLDRTKVKTLEKLKEAGFDTANKIKLLDGREILKHSLTTEMENIFNDREVFAVLNLKSKGQAINLNICSMGTLDSSMVSP